MRISVTPDGAVVVDGDARQVALALPAGTRAMQWDGQVGYAETATGLVHKDLADFQPWLDAWTAVGPSPLPPPTVISPLAFIERFTGAERAAIRAAAAVNNDVADWIDRARFSREIDLASVLTVQGMAALVDAGLLTSGRRDSILNTPVGATERP
jgi:hypothetical protein